MWQRSLIIGLCLVALIVGGAWDYLFGARKSTVAAAPTASAATSTLPIAAADKTGGTGFVYEYVPPKSAALQPIYTLLRDGDLLRKLPELHAIDSMFLLPRPIRYVSAECGKVDAFYSPDKGEVVLCYETVQVLRTQAAAVAAATPDDPTLADKYLRANLRFILSHETGHALVDVLDLPITGREEDAVDQLATTLMQKFAGANETPEQVAENLRMAGSWFLVRSQGQYNLDAYADAHALGEQRYFNLQCLIYGSDPAKFLSVVTDGDLPAARAQHCPAEAHRVYRSWLRLLLPHAAPKYRMSEAEAIKKFAELERQREKKADSPYLR